MQYVIQENVFRERHYDILEKSLNRLGLKYETVRCYPFIDKIVALKDIPEDWDGDIDDLKEYDPGTDEVFCFGAIKLARIASERKWRPGSMMNDNHDYMVYKKYWGENLLNADSKIHKLVDDLGWKPGEVKFIRPTLDTKAFTGALFTETEWNDSVENNLHNYRSGVFNEETLIQVSTPKDIQQEVRCWVVGGKIVTASTYRLGKEVKYIEYTDKDGLEFAQKMVNLYQLNHAFVIDICRVNDEWKIVEAGCLNAAGFYAADMQKLLMELEDYFNMINQIPEKDFEEAAKMLAEEIDSEILKKAIKLGKK